MIKRTTSSAWVAGIADALESQHLDVRALFAELGMDHAALGSADARFPTEKVSELWRLAAERSGNAAIGLTPRKAHFASFEVLGYAMMSSENLLAGLEHLARYLRVVTEAAIVRIEHGDHGSTLRFELIGGELPVPAQRYEFDLLVFLGFCGWVSGRDLRPQEVELAQPAPVDIGPYHDAFQCPLRFGAPEYCVRFARADLLRPLPAANSTLAELHARLLGEGLDRMGDARTSHRVRDLILQRLSNGEPKRGDIAKALFMSERTLQRRLQDEGTSFHEVLDGTRRELAQRHLRQRQVSLGQLAYLLGFADQSAFQRACKRWFDTSPRQYRNRVDSGPSDPAALGTLRQ